MYPWFIWNNSLLLLTTILFAIYSFFLLVTKKKSFSFQKIDLLFISSFILLCIWSSIYLKIGAFLNNILICIIIMMLVGLKQDIKQSILNYITKWYSIFIAISLLAYILFVFGIFKISPSNISLDSGDYNSLNYYFFIIPVELQYDAFWRFRAFLMEPGHMMLGTIPLIFANDFNLRNKYVVILILAVLFSFSLAGYLTMFIGFVLLKSNRNSITDIIIFLLSILIIYIILNITGNSSFLDEQILDRINLNDWLGGNTRRTTKSFDDHIYSKVISDPYLFLFGNGMSTEKLIALGGGAGYKVFLSQLGIFGVILVCITYTVYLLKYLNKKTFVYTLIFLLLLAQDSYPTWFCLTITYILGINHLKFRKKTKYEYTL